MAGVMRPRQAVTGPVMVGRGGRPTGQADRARSSVQQWRRNIARREEDGEGKLARLWRRLVQRLMKKGLTEVTSTHPKYNLLGKRLHL